MTGTSKELRAFESDRNLHTSSKRLPGEEFDEYKARMRTFNRKRKDYSKGIMVRPGKYEAPVMFNGKELKSPKDGKTITETKSHPPFRGSVKQLIKGQA